MKKPIKCYLAHAIGMRHWVREWELKLEEDTQIDFINPFYDGYEREDIDLIDKGKKDRYQVTPETIVEGDLKCIAESDSILAIADAKVWSVGTFMEIVYAYLKGIDIYVIGLRGAHQHPWIKYHANKIFTSVEEAEEYFKTL